MKKAKQPIRACLSNRIYWNSSCDWLIGNFLFGTEIGWEQLKKPPCTLHVKAKIMAISIVMILIKGSSAVITCTTWRQQRRVAPQWLSASAPPSGRPPRPRTAAPSLVQKPLQQQIIMFTYANHMCLPTSCILNFIASIPLVRTFKVKKNFD